MQRALTLVLLCLLIASASAGAYSVNAMNSLLAGYKVPNSVIAQLSPANVTVSRANYTLLYLNNSIYLVVNVTGANYSILANASSISRAIKPTILQNSLKKANFNSLYTLMFQYQNSSAPSINDCLFETGLSRGFTCTIANNCQACQVVPSCSKVLYQTNGPGGVFGLGVIQLGVYAVQLNTSYNNFFTAASSANANNEAANRALMNLSYQNISLLTRSIYQNPAFPPTPNITTSQYASCSSYSQASAPWYCLAIGYCALTTYNYTLLGKVGNKMNALSQLPMSDPQIMGIALNISATAGSYVNPILGKQKLAQANLILNTVLLNYSYLVNNTGMLLTHINDTNLSTRLRALKSVYANISGNYLTLNLAKANNSAANTLAQFMIAYNGVNKSYSYILGKAASNTALILKAQLNSRTPNPAIAFLAYNELQLNGQLTGSIGNVSALSKSLNSTGNQAQQYYSQSFSPISLTELARMTDSPFIRGLALYLGQSYPGNVSIAPVLAALLSLLIGIIAFALLAFFNSRLKKRRKVVLNLKTRRNWRLAFELLAVLVIIYMALTYLYASSANAYAPVGVFQNTLAGSKYLVVAINGTARINQLKCASLVSKTTIAMNKTPIVLSINGTSCTVGNQSKSLDSCMNFYSSRNIPMLILSNGNTTNMKVYSLFGTYLYASGNDSFMNSCYPSLLLK